MSVTRWSKKKQVIAINAVIVLSATYFITYALDGFSPVDVMIIFVASALCLAFWSTLHPTREQVDSTPYKHDVIIEAKVLPGQHDQS